MALIDIWNLYHSDNIRGRTFAQVSMSAKNVINESLITINLASNANSGQAIVTLVQYGGLSFRIGKVCVISDTGHSEDVTILSIAGDVITLSANLVNSYTTANGAKLTYKNNVERLAWANSVRLDTEYWANIMMWDVINTANVQSLGEACADNDIMVAITSSINDYAFNI